MRRRIALAVSMLPTLATLALAGCGGGTSGGLPTPEAGESGTTSAPSTTVAPKPSTAPATRPAKPGRPALIVVTGRFGWMSAVQGYARKYPIYFKALADRNSELIESTFPAYFFSDVEAQMDIAEKNGWVIKPPGSIVVRSVTPMPQGIVRISACRSQTTEYWDPHGKRWTITAPHGSADVVDMVRRGDDWVMYRWLRPVPKAFSCAGVRYPA